MRSRVTKEWSLSFRRRFIKDFTLNMIEYYKRKYPFDWVRFLNEIKVSKRSRANTFGQMMEGRKQSDLEWRWQIRLPAEYSRVLDIMLTESGEDRFWKDTKEMIWFRKEFPQFAIAEKT